MISTMIFIFSKSIIVVVQVNQLCNVLIPNVHDLPSNLYIYNLLGSKELGINVLELQFVMLANHDQNIFSLVLDLLKVC